MTFLTKYFTDKDYHDLKRVKDTSNEETQLGTQTISDQLSPVDDSREHANTTELGTIVENDEVSNDSVEAFSLTKKRQRRREKKECGQKSDQKDLSSRQDSPNQATSLNQVFESMDLSSAGTLRRSPSELFNFNSGDRVEEVWNSALP